MTVWFEAVLHDVRLALRSVRQDRAIALLALLTLTIAIALSVTSLRSMHLSPAALESAIRLLDSPGIPLQRGDNLETAGETIGKALG